MIHYMNGSIMSDVLIMVKAQFRSLFLGRNLYGKRGFSSSICDSESLTFNQR